MSIISNPAYKAAQRSLNSMAARILDRVELKKIPAQGSAHRHLVTVEEGILCWKVVTDEEFYTEAYMKGGSL